MFICRCPQSNLEFQIFKIHFTCATNKQHFRNSVFLFILRCWFPDVHKAILNFEIHFTDDNNKKQFRNSVFRFFKMYITSIPPKSIFVIQFTDSSNVDSRYLPVHQKAFLKFSFINCSKLILKRNVCVGGNFRYVCSYKVCIWHLSCTIEQSRSWVWFLVVDWYMYTRHGKPVKELSVVLGQSSLLWRVCKVERNRVWFLVVGTSRYGRAATRVRFLANGSKHPQISRVTRPQTVHKHTWSTVLSCWTSKSTLHHVRRCS